MRNASRTTLEWTLLMVLAASLLSRPADAQVPPPRDVASQAAELREARRGIETREAQALTAMAEKGANRGDREATATIKRLLPVASTADGPSRFTALPEIVARSAQGLASVKSETPKPAGAEGARSWRAELEATRKKAAGELFELAKRAATGSPPRYGEAAVCLRLVLERDPDHAEARRLMGYVPFQGGWARPFAVRQLKAGNVNHAVFGWVPADWVPHLEAGKLPAPTARGSRGVRWLPIDEADRMREGWKPPWQITTEHFEIQTNVPLGEAIEFGRRLEAFHDVFFTLMADVVAENLPLARRFRSPSSTPEASYRPHQVLYFATKDQYVDRLRPTMGPDASESLGYYNPPKPGTGNRAPAYFFRDSGGQLPVTATLYHEVSHQLLFETAGPNAYTKNAGNYWVFEGLGTYFETVTPGDDGSIEVGGLVGERIAAARRTLAEGRFEPLDEFLLLDQNGFNRPDRIHAHYQQAMALTVFLMQADRVGFRDAFLEYVRDAYRGRIKRSTGRSLIDRLGKPAPEIDARLRSFLESEDPLTRQRTGGGP